MQHILEAMLENTARHGDRPCFVYKDKTLNKWRHISWRTTGELVSLYARGLMSLGVAKGDSVAIKSSTRYEWTLLDLAIMSVGAITVPIYHNVTANQVSYICKDSEVKVLIIENDAQLKVLEPVSSSLPGVKHVVGIEDDCVRDNVLSLKSLISAAVNVSNELYEERLRSIKSSDVASCIYTSGTTGEPKGALITHTNIVGEVEGLLDAFPIAPENVGFAFLPLAHVIARAVQFVQIAKGSSMVYAESIHTVAENLKETHPHFMGAVPRVLEKIHDKILIEVEKSFIRKALFSWALDVGYRTGHDKRRGLKTPWKLCLQYFLAKHLVFRRIHRRLGGHMKIVVSGGAPLSEDIARFFHAIGLHVLEGYGLTETFAAITINRPYDFHIGTVGKPLKDVSIQLKDDGEIMVKGPNVFIGYRNKVDETNAALFEDGWLATGDLGEFSKDGFLRITGRKKDLIITSGGKKIAPQALELLLESCPFISQALVHGEGRKYITALVTLDLHNVKRFAEKNGIKFSNEHELAKNADVFKLIGEEVVSINKQLASYESIKKFAILDHDFSVKSGDLTPTLKIKRHLLMQKYADVLDGFYRE